MADVSVEARERMKTEYIREDRTVEGWYIETHYTPCKGIADADGYLRVLVDEKGYDTETRILHETLNGIGWVKSAALSANNQERAEAVEMVTPYITQEQFDRVFPATPPSGAAVKAEPDADFIQSARILAANQRNLVMSASKNVADKIDALCDEVLRLRATPPSGAAVKAEPMTQAHRKTALILAQRAVDAVVHENIGFFPRNDNWADEVLSLRDALE